MISKRRSLPFSILKTKEGTGQLTDAPSQSQDCPSAPRERSQGTEEETPRYPHRVFVLASNGHPLMPCSPRKARTLLKAHEAVVAHRLPFTIRLKKATSSHTQPIELKLDPGSKFTGIALVANNQPIYLAELEHRGQLIHKNLTSRAQCRRRRRSSNLRYRPARFNNRNKPEGWLAPSLRHRIETTSSWIKKFRQWAPITGLAQELVRFDLQKMENPEISGVEYQQGTLVGYEVREYLLEKWGRKCAYCDAQDTPLEIEHVVSKAHGGTNRISNLTVACHHCNQAKSSRTIEDFLRGNPDRLKKVKAQLKAPLKDAAAVNSTRWALLNTLKETGLTVRTGSGGQTKWNRTRFHIPKSHAFDALCVSEVTQLHRWSIPTLRIKAIGHGSHQVVRPDAFGFPRTKLGEPRPRTRRFTYKNPELKGQRRSELVRPKGELEAVKGLKGKRPHGLATGDTVKLPDGLLGRVSAARTSGSTAVKVPGGGKDRNITFRKLTLVEKASGYDTHW